MLPFIVDLELKEVRIFPLSKCYLQFLKITDCVMLRLLVHNAQNEICERECLVTESSAL